MPKITIKNEIPILKEGEVRVMFDDGLGTVVIDFEPGPVNTVLRSMVNDYIKSWELYGSN